MQKRRMLILVTSLVLVLALSGCIFRRFSVTVTCTPLIEKIEVGTRERDLPYSFSVRKGQTVNVKAPLVPGYDFEGWLVNNELRETAEIAVTIEDNTTIKAVYRPRLVNEMTYGGSGEELGKGLVVESSSEIVIGITSSSTDSSLILENKGGSDFWAPYLQYASGNYTVEPQLSLGGSKDENLLDTVSITGGYVSVGWTVSGDIVYSGGGYPYHGGTDGYVVMTSNDGSLKWQTYLGGSGDDKVFSVNTTVGEKLVVTGMTTSSDSNFVDSGYHGSKDGWTAIMSSNGTLITGLIRAYGGSEDDELLYGMQTKEGGYIVCGYSKSSDGDLNTLGRSTGEDLWIMKLDQQLNILWQDLLGGQNNERANVAKEVSDGYIAAGFTESTGGDVNENKGGKDLWVLKFSFDGGLEWSRTYGGSEDDEGFDIIETADGGYAVCGYTESSDGDISHENRGMRDLWIVKLGPDGYLEWESTLGGSKNETAARVRETEKRELIVIGTTASSDRDIKRKIQGPSDAWLLRLGR